MKRPKRPFLVAVTGGIASGKTLLCREFEDQGLRVYYSDKIAHQILQQPKIKKQIAEQFKEFDLLKNGQLDRELLGDLVFEDPEKLKYLNTVIHPLVRLEIQKIIDHSQAKVIVFEIPLLVENKLQGAFDLTINLHSDKKDKLERLIINRKISREKAEKIIEAQIDPDVRIEKTDLTIYNSGDINELLTKTRNLINILDSFPFKKVKKIKEI